jgi:6-phosphogluconolactonase
MEGSASGIGIAQQRDDGSLEVSAVAAVTPSPSFIVSAHSLVYAVDESNSRAEVFRPSGGATLEHLGGASTSGAYPCHLSVTRRRLYVSNYGSGTVDVFALSDGGLLGDLLQTFDGLGATPHAHSTLVAGSTVLSADLGDDRVHVHRLSDGMLERVGSGEFPVGTGPRDLLRSREGVTYLLGELSGAIFAIDDEARILAAGSVAADWVDGDHAAALALDASGRYLYTGLRGSDRIAVVDALTLVPIASVDCGGSWPRHLVVSGQLLHVANERSSTIATFRIDSATGIPTLVAPPQPAPTPTYLAEIQESGRR